MGGVGGLRSLDNDGVRTGVVNNAKRHVGPSLDLAPLGSQIMPEPP